ncbi:hypothetical protein mRhiFer1_008629 [Rhinolophus ferrumequinum]|uniref:Uncharacterized protein n=1 Tax=Rhinolophus ferrumequinum TaxID=59479 RepID=A0A7J7U117_RHIFE|nr:hypothetical protein mRhiFer1_008629 [Rhinolophus ferrumequinum]
MVNSPCPGDSVIKGNVFLSEPFLIGGRHVPDQGLTSFLLPVPPQFTETDISNRNDHPKLYIDYKRDVYIGRGHRRVVVGSATEQRQPGWAWENVGKLAGGRLKTLRFRKAQDTLKPNVSEASVYALQ